MAQQKIKRLQRLLHLLGVVVLLLIGGLSKPLRAVLNPIQSETQQGNVAFSEGNFSLARIHYQTALNALFKPNEKKILLPWGKALELWERAKLHNNLGLSYAAEGEFEKAQLEYRTALKLFELSHLIKEREEKNALAEVFFNQGNAFFQQAQYEKAVKAYLNSLALKENITKVKYNLELALKQLAEQDQKQAKQKTIREERAHSTGAKAKAGVETEGGDGRSTTSADYDEKGERTQASSKESKARSEQNESLETLTEEFSKAQAEAILEQLQNQKKRKKIPFFNEKGRPPEGKLW